MSGVKQDGGACANTSAITGYLYGVEIYGAAGTVTNSGSIAATAVAGMGVELLDGGDVTNNSGGSISGGAFGVYVTGGARVVNAGAIGGTTASVEFAGAGANYLTLNTGSTLAGAAIGSTASGATNALVLQGNGAADNDFDNFNTLDVQASGAWTLGGDSTIGATTLATGALIVAGELTTALTQSAAAAATIDSDDTLTLTGISSLGAAVNGAGTLDIAGGDTTISAGANISVADWLISGSGTLVTLDEALSYASAFGEGEGSTVSLTGGPLALSGGADLSGGTVNGSGRFTTEGATIVSGLTIGGSVVWTNTGTATQSGANLTLGDGGGAAAILSNTATGTYDITDDTGVSLGASTASRIFNAGLFEKTGGTSFSVISASMYDTGTISDNIAGNHLELDGAHNRLSGTYIGPGMIDYGPDGVSTLGTLNMIGDACSGNGGVVNVTGIVTIADGSTLQNFGRWNFAGDVGLNLAPGSTDPTFTNWGTLAKTVGTGTSLLELSVDDGFTGTVIAVSGVLAFAGPSNSFNAPIGGAGAVSFAGGDTTLNSGVKLMVANLSETGAGTNVTVATNLAYSGGFSQGAGSTIDLNGGGLTLTGSADFAGGAVDGSARLNTEGATEVSGLTIGGTVAWTNTGALTQSGSNLTLGDGSGAGAMLANSSTGTYAITDNTGVALGASTASEILNSGLFEKTGGAGTSAVAAGIINNGAIAVAIGTLDLQGSLTGAGQDQVDGAATLEVDGAVGPGQTLVYSGSGGDLALDDLYSGGSHLFHGTISGFGAGDELDAGAPFGTGTTFQFTENSGGTAGTLALTDPTGTIHAWIHFLGDYSKSNFAPSSDLNGGTLFTFSA